VFSNAGLRNPLTPSVVKVYGMKAARRLAENVSALLTTRRHKQTDLAQWCRRSDVWVSQFLRGERNWQLDDLDRVADFFGLATYQLFQPGISPLTERRRGGERRTMQDRRVGPTQRVMLQAAANIETHRPQRKGSPHVTVVASSPLMAAIDRLNEDYDRRLAAILATESGGQAPAPRKALTAARPRRRAAGGSDPPKSE
jgi:hypothetical protein